MKTSLSNKSHVKAGIRRSAIPFKKFVLPDFRARLRESYGDKVISADVMGSLWADNKGRY